jgi:hypothetical protein
MDLVEAQIAKGLGTRLCRCTRPPIPMVLVGVQPYQGRHGNILRRYVFQCPRCKKTVSPGGYATSDTHGFLASD